MREYHEVIRVYASAREKNATQSVSERHVPLLQHAPIANPQNPKISTKTIKPVNERVLTSMYSA